MSVIKVRRVRNTFYQDDYPLENILEDIKPEDIITITQHEDVYTIFYKTEDELSG